MVNIMTNNVNNKFNIGVQKLAVGWVKPNKKKSFKIPNWTFYGLWSKSRNCLTFRTSCRLGETQQKKQPSK